MVADSGGTTGAIKPVEYSRKHEDGEQAVASKLQETAARVERIGDTKAECGSIQLLL